MNKIRRTSLQEIIDQLEELKSRLNELKEEEEEYMENIPENLKRSERHESAEIACNSLYEAMDNLDNATINIDMAIQC